MVLNFCIDLTRGRGGNERPPHAPSWAEERDVYYQVGRVPKKIAKKVEKLREAKAEREATTLRRVQLARLCRALWGGLVHATEHRLYPCAGHELSATLSRYIDCSSQALS